MGVQKLVERIEVNAIAFQEGDAWVIQGIEYDIVAHASSVAGLERAFTRAVIENCAITEHLGRKPLEGIKPAPHHFRELFESAEVELTSLRPNHDTLGKRPNVSVRVTERVRAA